jgi:RHS repeat-associated protein
MGRLYQVVQGASTTRMGYDGLDRIAEYDGSNAIQRRYLHGPGVDNPIAWYEGTGTTGRSFLSSDERGSIVSVTDGAGGVLSLNSYDEYGIPGSSNIGAFGYTGQTWLPQIGMWYYKARLYSPTLGRFLQTDPIGYEGDGPNPYSYVLNPLNSTDPLGEQCDCNVVVTGRVPQPPAEPGAKDANDYWTGGQQYFVQQLGALLAYANQLATWCANNPQRCGAPKAKKKEPKPGHHYDPNERLCTVSTGHSCHLDRVNSEMCVLPGRTSKRSIVSGRLYGVSGDYGSPIRPFTVQTIQTGPYSFRNSTRGLHPFSGTVDRIFTQDAAGNIDVTTIGQGTSAVPLIGPFLDWVNENVGPYIFADQNRLCAAYVGGR